MSKLRLNSSCHSCEGRCPELDHSTALLSPKPAIQEVKKVALMGSPNAGKSVMFYNLTGSYVTVSNYPGTTVGVARGKGKIFDQPLEVIDSPGIYSLLPITEEESVARRILWEERPHCVVQMVDSKNLERMLLLTLQLLDTGLPLVMALNFMDETQKLGMSIDHHLLEERLGIPVVPTVSTSRQGLDLLKRKIYEVINGEREHDTI